MAWSAGSAAAAKVGIEFCVPRDLQTSAVTDPADGSEYFTRVHAREKVGRTHLSLLLLLLLLLNFVLHHAAGAVPRFWAAAVSAY